MGIFGRNRLATAAQLAQPVPTVTEIASPWQDNDYLATVTLSELFGLENMPIDRAAAMSVGAISRGRDLICTQVGRFPMRVTKGQAIVQRAWADQPEIGRSRATTISWICDAMLFFGRAFLEITGRYSDTYPSRFSWVPEWNARTDGSGQLLAVGNRRVNPGQWLRIDAPHEGLLTRACGDIRDAVALKRAVRKASDNPVPSIELHQTGGDPMSPAAIDDLVDRWMEARRRTGVGYTNQSVELKTHGQALEQLMIDARNQSAIDLTRHMNLPAWAVDATVSGGSMTYTNVPSRSRELLDYTLQPYLDAIAGRLSLGDVLPAGQTVTFDTTQFLAGDFGTRMTAYATAISAGIYTADECRLIEAGQPVPLRTGQENPA
jgi:hypothetical protein